MSATNPYDQGYAACLRCKPWLPARQRAQEACPYDKSSIKSNRWWSGWHQAARDHKTAEEQPTQTQTPAATVNDWAQPTLFEAALATWFEEQRGHDAHTI